MTFPPCLCEDIRTWWRTEGTLLGLYVARICLVLSSNVRLTKLPETKSIVCLFVLIGTFNISGHVALVSACNRGPNDCFFAVLPYWNAQDMTSHHVTFYRHGVILLSVNAEGYARHNNCLFSSLSRRITPAFPSMEHTTVLKRWLR